MMLTIKINKINHYENMRDKYSATSLDLRIWGQFGDSWPSKYFLCFNLGFGKLSLRNFVLNHSLLISICDNIYSYLGTDKSLTNLSVLPKTYTFHILRRPTISVSWCGELMICQIWLFINKCNNQSFSVIDYIFIFHLIVIFRLL